MRQRRKSECHRRRIAARVGNAGARDYLAANSGEFRKTVRPGSGVVAAVERGPGVGGDQAEIRAQIHHQCFCGQLFDQSG